MWKVRSLAVLQSSRDFSSRYVSMVAPTTPPDSNCSLRGRTADRGGSRGVDSVGPAAWLGPKVVTTARRQVAVWERAALHRKAK